MRWSVRWKARGARPSGKVIGAGIAAAFALTVGLTAAWGALAGDGDGSPAAAPPAVPAHDHEAMLRDQAAHAHGSGDDAGAGHDGHDGAGHEADATGTHNADTHNADTHNAGTHNAGTHNAGTHNAGTHNAGGDHNHTADTTGSGDGGDHDHGGTSDGGTGGGTGEHDHGGTGGNTGGNHDHDNNSECGNPAHEIMTLEDPCLAPADRQAAQALIDRTRTALAAHGLLGDFTDAQLRAKGYYWINDSIGGFRHYVNWGYTNLAIGNDTVEMDEHAIESLVVKEVGGGTVRVVSAMYILNQGKTMGTVPTIAGKITTWHDHQNLCWSLGRWGTPVVTGLTRAPGDCGGIGVFFATPPMLHVWMDMTGNNCGPFAGVDAGGVMCHHDH